MKKYHKIDSIYKRDPETDYSTFLDEYSKPEFKYLADNEWRWTEKVHGTNIRVHFDGENVFFGGRTEKAQIPTHLLTELQQMFSTIEKRQVFQEKFGHGVTLYGEGYGEKIQDMGSDYLEDDHSFVLFDVKINDYWLQREDVEGIAESLDIDVVPIVGYGTLDEAVEKTKKGFKSEWGDFTAEGLILKPTTQMFNRKGERVITKVKHKDFD